MTRRPVCDNTCVGVLVHDHTGRFLFFERPDGLAPICRHLDARGTPDAVARLQAWDDAGMTVSRVREVWGGWRPNRCRRGPGRHGIGHQWRLYEATVTAPGRPAASATPGLRWLSVLQLQQLAVRTIAHAERRVPPAAFAANPGLAPVWVRFLADLNLIRTQPADLAAVEAIT